MILKQLVLQGQASMETLYPDSSEEVRHIARIISSMRVDFKVDKTANVIPTSHEIYAAQLIMDYINGKEVKHI